MRLEWKHRFLTNGLPGKSVHSIVKNICFQKKKKGKEGRQGRKKTGDRRGRCIIIVFFLQTRTPWVWILFNTEEFFSSAHILVTAIVEESAMFSVCSFTLFLFYQIN